MRRILSTLTASAILATGLAFAGAGNASAAGTITSGAVRAATTPLVETSQVEEVQYRKHRRYHRGQRWNRHHGRRHFRRHHRPHWHNRNSGVFLQFGVPGVHLSVRPQRHYGVRPSSAHIRWCENRYRSYRRSDNTFQPYNGPRKQCWSPYS